ncbi:MAG: hypothetical protein ACKVP0_00690 [Pirellulaceae bacterium]
MKFFALCVVTLSLIVSAADAADEPPKSQAQAAAYFEALTTGDVEKANSLAGIPFSLDRKRILKTADEVNAIHKQIVESKGKRPVPKYKIAPTDKAPKLDPALFPKYVAFRVVIDDESLDIYVSVGEAPKILGFSD